MQKQQSQSQNEKEEAEQQQNSQEEQEQQSLQEDQDEQQSLSATITYFETSPVQEDQQAQVEGENEEEQQEIERVHDKTLSSSISGERRGDGVLKGLERRYHLLYLKAIEVQCFFENIIERKKTPVSILIIFIHISIYLISI